MEAIDMKKQSGWRSNREGEAMLRKDARQMAL